MIGTFDIFQQQITMQMKINFDQLFNSASPADLNTTVESPSIELSHEITSSLNNSVQYKFSFNHKFFDSQEFEQREIIYNREDSEVGHLPKSVKSIKVSNNGQSNKSQPGQRLFYQSQEQEERKRKEREKIQQEKQIELSKSVTFVPTINQKSRKIAQKLKEEPKQYTKSKNILKPTVEIIEEANQKECTFHPKLIAKNKHQNKSKDELFYYLHNTAKIKDMKINKLAQEQYGQYGSNTKKGNQEDITNFLKRNEQYTSIVKKKQEILKTNSQRYDLKTGEKLFSPKIIQNKAHYFHATASVKDMKSESSKNSQQNWKSNDKNQFKSEINDNSPKPKQKSGIFNKKYRADIETHEQQEKSSPYVVNKDGSKSYHEAIAQVQQNSMIQNQKGNHKYQNLNIFNPDHPQDQIQGEEINIWGSNQIKPFELSNVNQYLNASDQEQQQHKNNYVMEILNNLMIRHDEQP